MASVFFFSGYLGPGPSSSGAAARRQQEPMAIIPSHGSDKGGLPVMAVMAVYHMNKIYIDEIEPKKKSSWISFHGIRMDFLNHSMFDAVHEIVSTAITLEMG